MLSFHSLMLNYQRVYPIKSHSTPIFLWLFLWFSHEAWSSQVLGSKMSSQLLLMEHLGLQNCMLFFSFQSLMCPKLIFVYIYIYIHINTVTCLRCPQISSFFFPLRFPTFPQPCHDQPIPSWSCQVPGAAAEHLRKAHGRRAEEVGESAAERHRRRGQKWRDGDTKNMGNIW